MYNASIKCWCTKYYNGTDKSVCENKNRFKLCQNFKGHFESRSKTDKYTVEEVVKRGKERVRVLL